MRYFEVINEGRDAMLYRGIREVKYAVAALNSNSMAATTTQRFWADGKRRKDDDPEYENSFWMKGVSTTRDINFAARWGRVVFVLDQSRLQQRYKIIPLNWGYSIVGNNHHKREREEFVVAKSTMDKYMLDPDEFDEKPRLDFERFISPDEGEIKPLSSFLTGIYLDRNIENLEPLSSYREVIENPKFLGYYSLVNRTKVEFSKSL